MTPTFRRDIAPAPLAPRDFNLPVPTEFELANGLKLVVVEDKRLPLVNFRLIFKTGRANDPQDIPGLSGMTAGMLTEGTTARTSLQIASEVERIGAALGASAGVDNTTVAASALAQYKTLILNLLADVVLRPTFPTEELAIQRDLAKQGLVAQRAQPAFLSDERLSKVLYGAHPYSIVSTNEHALNQLTPDVLRQFHRETFVPNNAVLIAVGAVDAEDLKREIEDLFGAWAQGDLPQVENPVLPERSKREIFVVDRAGSAQSHITLANLAMKRNAPDYFAALVMNQVLGAGASSRLFMNLREEKDMTYGAYSSFDARRHAGSFESSAEVRGAVTGAALHEFFYELERIRSEAVPEQELADAKNYLTGVFPIRLETQEGLVNQLQTIYKFDLPANFLQTYRENINKITAADVQQTAQKYIQPDKMAIVIVGEAAQIRDQIKEYAASIELFDVSGQPKTEGNSEMNPQTATEIWNLTLSSPQGDVPVTLKLNTDGGNLSGVLTTPFGDGTISGGVYDLKTLNTTANLNFQGMSVNAQIAATIENDVIEGNVTTGIPGFPPLQFKGTRADTNI